jgi:transposase
MDHGSPNLAENLKQCQRRIRELEQIVVQQRDVIAGYQEQLAQASEQLCLLKRALFGRRRERYAPSPDQLLLFTPEAVDGLSHEKATPAEEAPPTTGRRRRGKGKRIVFPQFFERQRVDHPLSPEEVACGCCGTQRTIIRTHVTAQLEMEQAKVYVLEHVRYTYACPDCREGSQVVTTEKPPQAVEKSPFGPSVLAGLVTWKFLHHLPLYRQQELLLGPMKQWLSRPLLCGLMRRTAVALRPLERLIRQQVLRGAVINADETPVKMLKPGHGRTVTGYVTGYAGDLAHPFVFYDFRVSRSRDGPEEMLASYRGYLQTDGYVVYTSLVSDSGGRLVDVACWAHGRRGFEEALQTTSDVLVHEALVWIQQLYDLEDRAREFPADERRALREEEAVPILQRMKARFLEVRPTLRPKSKLAAAVDYVLNRWEAFVRYTSDGRIPIDNNLIERLLRPVAVGRKNYLFFGSEKGGQTAATLYTLVQSARRNCVDVWPYLTDVLRRLPAIPPTDTAALETLLPDRWLQTHPEHRLTEREEESREAQARRRRKRAARRAAASA